MNIGIICISKNEELYLDEWINYHQNLGINKIYFLDNNDSNSQTQKDIVKKYNIIEYIDIRGQTIQNKNFYIQTTYYKKVYNNIRKLHDWILFLDIDEFFCLEDTNLENFFSNENFKDCSQILFNWKCYGDNDLVKYDSRNVQERFTKPYNMYDCFTNGCIENEICKPALNCKYECINHNIHTSTMNYNVTKNSIGNVIQNYWKQSPIIHKIAYIKHYPTKTIEEFIIRRIKTKRNHMPNEDTNEILLNKFFNVNSKNEYKLKIIKEMLEND